MAEPVLTERVRLDIKLIWAIGGALFILATMWGGLQLKVASIDAKATENRHRIEVLEAQASRAADVARLEAELAAVRDEMKRVRDRLDKLLDMGKRY